MVDGRVGAEASFEERQRATRALAHELLWLEEEVELRALVATAEKIEIAGKMYRRLEQPSSSFLTGLVGQLSPPCSRLRPAHQKIRGEPEGNHQLDIWIAIFERVPHSVLSVCN